MIETPYRPWMHSLLDRMKELYGKVDAKTIAEALPDGGFFKIKGSVATVDDLPVTGNTVGDIFIVSADGSEHIWVTSEDHPDGYWEQLGSEGSSVIVDTEMSPTSTNPVQNKVIYAALAYAAEIVDGKEDKALHETISDAAVEITPEPNVIYHCGTLTSLTITDPYATGAYSIIFTSGHTPTQTTIPATILGLESFAAEANTLYEINVLDNRAVVGSWAVSA